MKHAHAGFMKMLFRGDPFTSILYPAKIWLANFLSQTNRIVSLKRWVQMGTSKQHFHKSSVCVQEGLCKWEKVGKHFDIYSFITLKSQTKNMGGDEEHISHIVFSTIKQLQHQHYFAHTLLTRMRCCFCIFEVSLSTFG